MLCHSASCMSCSLARICHDMRATYYSKPLISVDLMVLVDLSYSPENGNHRDKRKNLPRSLGQLVAYGTRSCLNLKTVAFQLVDSVPVGLSQSPWSNKYMYMYVTPASPFSCSRVGPPCLSGGSLEIELTSTSSELPAMHLSVRWFNRVSPQMWVAN